MAFTQPHFGRHRWELPLHTVPLPAESDKGAGAFAAALLSGAVTPAMGRGLHSLTSKLNLRTFGTHRSR